MNSAIRLKVKQAIAGVALFCMAAQPTLASLVRIDITSEPLFVGATVTPKVMLTISKDQQLFKKAYNDYSDLDPEKNDGIETTYKHSILYYGYFDSHKCYDYASPGGPNGRFEPKNINTDPVTGMPGLCTGRWHGNFLNWVSMTRMDTIRKLLYGGMRSTDGTTMGVGTVLERAYLPTDAHAWAKYYNPAAPGATAAEQPPIDKLTPFSGLSTAPTVTTPTINSVIRPGNVTVNPPVIALNLATDANQAAGQRDPIFRFAATPAGFAVGDQLRLSVGGASVTGAVKSISGNDVTLSVAPASIIGTGTGTGFTVTNLSNTGISFCNMTPTSGTAADQKSQTNTQAPLIRVAKGNYGLWSANERFQCLWSSERSATLSGFFTQPGSNGNHAVLSGIDASAENPNRTTHALSAPAAAQGEYIARVKVCESEDLIGGEKCSSYGGMLKPVGLLQEYGDDDRIHFGLTTGSFTNNTEGGVLRKNISSFTNEVDLNNGTFKNPDHYRPPNAPRATNSTATVPGIVNTLNYLRIYGYYYGNSGYNDGTYLGSTGDNCNFQLVNLNPGDCTSWGNPMAEIFFDALRYFANQPPVSTVPADSKDNQLGLPRVVGAARTDPLAGTLYCAKMSALVFNASVSTNEDNLRSTLLTAINGEAGAAPTASAHTSALGDAEGISGKKFFVGQSDVAAPAGELELCTAKTVNKLGEVLGICPEGPTLLGSYLIGGLAHFANTTRIRSDGTNPAKFNPTIPASDKTSMKVTSYGIQLATNTPELVIPVPGSTTQRVVIQPIYRLNIGAGLGGGALVDMKFVSQTVDPVNQIATGKVYVNWEDSEQGGDYDQDMWGIIEWVLDGKNQKITVTTNAIASSTGGAQGFGFTIGGTTKDGPHFFSGLAGFSFKDPQGVVVTPANFAGCDSCRAETETDAGQKGAQKAEFTLSPTASTESLKDPLWYLAKYGGFKDSNDDKLPNVTSEYDKRTTSGAEVTNGDGIPDNYFLVTNPLGLEAALRAAFESISLDQTATAFASNTTSLQVGATVFSARFDPRDWSGNLLALPIENDGTLGNAKWDAQTQLRALPPSDRNIYTYDDRASQLKGTKLVWPAASGQSGAPAATIPRDGTLYKNLNTSPDTGLVDNKGSLRLDYLRGDRTKEVAPTNFRKRSEKGPLGDIVNSNPNFVPEPRANILDLDYAKFREDFKDRTHMVYVAANDGMLHGFDANTGTEMLAYVPSKTFTKLNQLTSPAYVNKHRAFVDGSPEVADAWVNDKYRTVLVGALGVGGQGLYALDVTDPSKFGTTNPVLWEFNDTDDSSLGYITSQPVIRMMASSAGGKPRWAAIVSGGYNNTDADGNVTTTNGNAFLYIIFLDGPTKANGSGGKTWEIDVDYVKIDTGVGYNTAAGTPDHPNGLARPLAIDSDANGSVNFIYAGDLKGNMWKFNVSDSSQSNWKGGSRRVVLFAAKDAGNNPQPITAQAEGALHPSGKGYIINFGTGQYLEIADRNPANFKTQSYYGIWDKNDHATTSSQTTISNRSQLLEQVITNVTDAATGNIVRTIERAANGLPKPLPWSTDTTPPVANDTTGANPAKFMGWRMDFPSSNTTGERAVFVPLLRGGRLIFTTLLPTADPCQGGGTSFLMVLDPATGGPFTAAAIDTNEDGVVDVNDAIGGTPTAPVFASGMQSEVGITNTPRLVIRPPSGGSGTANPLGGSTSGGAAALRNAYAIQPGTKPPTGGGPNAWSPLITLGTDAQRVSWREMTRD